MIDLSEFYEIQTRLVAQLPSTRRLSFFEKINWDARLVGLIGARGTGKTTLLLQRLADRDATGRTHLYISADHLKIQSMGLYDIAASFFKLGGTTIIIDEIHKYGSWSLEIKNLYDSFPKANIYISGSSTLALQAGKADLSRRIVYYRLPGLSFREYLHLSGNLDAQPVEIADILNHHQELSRDLLHGRPILGYFQDYLDHGIYPFFLEGITEYLPRLLNVLEKAFYEDIPSDIGTKVGNVVLLKRILWLIATSQPFVPNIEKMSRELRISKPYVYTYIDALERSALILNLFPAETGYRLIRKPSKIYIENTNLLIALAGSAGAHAVRGTMRETFFANQVAGSGGSLSIPRQGDFLVQDHHLFEIGGRSKGSSQIAKAENAFVVQDDIEAGHGHTVPLWLFGFLY